MFELERFLRKGKADHKVTGLFLINAVCIAAKKKFGEKVRAHNTPTAPVPPPRRRVEHCAVQDAYAARLIEKGLPGLETLKECTVEDKVRMRTSHNTCVS